ncbi:patatin-like phospholipase family protein [Candidatus Oleimmundimicrobium sp.]|uniref:patatin-like phospholipase family protein n=1 Tax=Candidatus Oleimmundimicrobium sp. TaxID=3060597 RepID=UPI00271FD4C2|nr:patatin-like phospholipase family protein [Candidatus Oleimmundimicrobium sp.]MDO8886499.1 patatin-like phospholipase family protein [Candidatus Oleimmundimicrobium sp.]
MKQNRPKVGLVLSGGGAKGVAHLGVLKVLEKENIPIDMIVGTSIGALIGGIYASEMNIEEMEKIALNMNWKQLLRLTDLTKPTTALVNGQKIENFINSLVNNKTFDDTRIPFAAIAVDAISGKEAILTRGHVTDAIRASISTPVVFSPVKRGNKLLIDGGVINPLPADVARKMGADVVIAVNLLTEASTKNRFSHLPETSNRKIVTKEVTKKGFPEIVYSRMITSVKKRFRPPTVFQLAMRAVDLMQRELSEAKLKYASLVIAPQVEDVSYYDFSKAKEIITLGERAAEKAIPDIKKILEG